MGRINYVLHKILSMFYRDSNAYMVNYYREMGVSIGDGTRVFSEIVSSEPYLITIGHNTTIATGVTFLTHDASIGPLIGREKASDLCGKIVVGDNCFIGHGVILLYGVNIPPNCIVAAGSVVTKSFKESGIILGGNPAKKIGTVDDYIRKHEKDFLKLHGLSADKRKEVITNNQKALIER